MTVASIDPDNHIQLPAAWIHELGLQNRVVLKRTNEGILVRPCPRLSWDDIFATKLVPGSAPPNQGEDTDEAAGGDFLF